VAIRKLGISDIKAIQKSSKGKGYDIIFNDGRVIYITKRRVIIALLVLLKYGSGTEADLAQGNKRIPEIKTEMKGKIPDGWIQDYYGDANKPFSELWNEEGFSFIQNPTGERRGKSQMYILKPEDHDRLFSITSAQKAYRKQPSNEEKRRLREAQKSKCNICGVIVKPLKQIQANSFCKDRRAERFDHRVPIEKSGKSEYDNYQLLCFYCNKSKWQICNICHAVKCDNCALAFPEKSSKITPTNEDISDILAKREKRESV
jgi:hypothetical protein